MDIRTLRYFLAVAREENITRAAHFLHIAQPSLSVQLMELEQKIGKKLMIRGKRKITLTDEGVLLRKRAEEILSLVEKTERELASDDEIINGDISIGSGETEAMSFIITVAKELSLDFPNIRYNLYSGDADAIMEKIDKGILDFGIVMEPINSTKYESLSLNVTDVWGLLMKKNCPFSNKNSISAKDLKNIPLIIPKRDGIQKDLSNWLENNFDDLNIVATYNIIYTASLMVQKDFGYAITLDKLIDTSQNSELCFKPFSPKINANLCIIWKKYQVFSRASEKFIERLKKKLS